MLHRNKMEKKCIPMDMLKVILCCLLTPFFFNVLAQNIENDPSFLKLKLISTMEKKRPLLFAHYLQQFHQQNLAREDYLELLKMAAHKDLPPCFFKSLVKEIGIKFPHLEVDQYFHENGPLKNGRNRKYSYE